ncbi:MAG: prohibitin family protein, partial [Chloroflexaceae bacterium]|nr:prohibitin family protein [Chloroflexaceae bacterium]
MSKNKTTVSGGAGAVGILVVIGFILVVVGFLLLNSFTVVDAGTRGVVRTFGEVTDIYGEGLHFRAPMITDVIVVDVRTQRHQSDSSAASRDLQIVQAQVVLNYRPDATKVDSLVRDIGTDYVNVVVDPAIQESVKAATAKFTAEQLITQRPEVSGEIREVLEARLSSRGIIVEDLSITDFQFSEEFRKAIEA